MYGELCKPQEPIINHIKNLSIFLKNYNFGTIEENWDQFSLVGDISGALGCVCCCEKTDDEEYFELLTLLTSDEWTSELGWSGVWNNDALTLVERIKSPIMQVDGLLLLLEDSVLPRLITEISFPWNQATQAELLVGLLSYLTPKLRKQAFEISKNISNEFDKTWVFVVFAPYLSKGRKRRVIQDALEVIDKPNDFITTAQKVLIIKQLIKYGLGC